MTNELGIGKRYRFTLRIGNSTGSLEGVVRSTSLPAGMLGNRDGEHCIWIAGEQLEWFVRPTEIAEYEAVQDHSGMSKTSRLPARSLRPEAPYRGRCVRRVRPGAHAASADSYPLLQYLVARHRRDAH